MKKSIYLIALLGCVLFAGCNKLDDDSDSKEDLSYLIRTYYRYETSSHQIIKQTWSYDGYKPMGYKYYIDGHLSAENNNYSYDGLNASWDYYAYNNYDVNDIRVREHIECEYLDDTYRRVKHEKTQYYYSDPQDNYIYETYYVYDGKKKLSQKSYKNGILSNEIHYSYEGLRCTYTTTSYYDSSDAIQMEQSYDIAYLDDTYLRTKSYLRTRKIYDTNGNLTSSDTNYYIYDYDGKKLTGYQYFRNGQLSAIARDYQYDGLTCYYFVDNYQDGEVTSTQMYEVEYLE